MNLFKKHYQQAWELTPERAGHGTPYFRSYYEDYELREVVGADEVARSRFVYTGMLYRLDAPDGARQRRKALHLALLVVSVVCIALGGTQNAMANTGKVGALSMFALILMTLLRASAVVFYCISSEELKEWDYKRGVCHLYKYSLVCALCSFAVMVIDTVYFLMFWDVPSLLSAALQLPCALSALISWCLERKANWQVVACQS